ncbi:MAG: hypothetical protein EA368_14935 [Leptolyngbya sp. DLM2.Bin27]|nr:MAG: hypothetical protein EA368_14935 [Leptolyngbya sp. DLM2.Bin27]
MNSFSLETAASPWLRETVQTFFEAVAWDGRPAAVALGLEDPTRAESAMTMTVSAFFNSIAWDGQPTIGVPISPLEVAPAVPKADLDLTLDGFSDLFG